MVKDNIEFEHLLLDYLDTFDLSDYLDIIDAKPDSDPDFSLFYMSNRDFLGFDFAAQLSQNFESIGLERQSYLGMLDGYEASMKQFVLDLCRQLSRRQAMEKTSSHVQSRPEIISDSLLDFLICAVTESINYHKWETPNAYVILMFARHNVLNGSILKQFRKNQKQVAAVKTWGRDPEASLNQVAERVGVNKATLSRWVTDDVKFKEKLEWRLGFDEEKFFDLIRDKITTKEPEDGAS